MECDNSIFSSFFSEKEVVETSRQVVKFILVFKLLVIMFCIYVAFTFTQKGYKSVYFLVAEIYQ